MKPNELKFWSPLIGCFALYIPLYLLLEMAPYLFNDPYRFFNFSSFGAILIVGAICYGTPVFALGLQIVLSLIWLLNRVAE